MKTPKIEGLRQVKVVPLTATDGKEIIATASDVFCGGIHGATKRRGAPIPTEAAKVIIYKIIRNDTTEQILLRLGAPTSLCWQESQIVAFCRNYRGWAPGTSFLFKRGDKVHVASSGSAPLCVVVGPYGGVKTWPSVVGRKIAILKQ